MLDIENNPDDDLQATATRRLVGIGIASTVKIEMVDGLYLVPSTSSLKRTKYKVFINGASHLCTCEDFTTRQRKCKHIFAVEHLLKTNKGIDNDNGLLTRPRKTYRQDWKSYNAAQQNEKSDFQKLLAAICEGIVDPSEKSGRGRPAFPLSDAVFSVVYKVYSTFSGRRFTSDLCDAHAKGFINRVPHYNTAFKCIENPKLFPILTDLVQKSSLPLKSLEQNFAVDSTGFTTSRFVRWYDHKYNAIRQEHDWVKAHLICGVKTNIVTAVEIHGRLAQDSPILPSLVATTAKNFNLNEVSADKGYSSIKNSDVISSFGAMPFIAYKSHHTGSGDNIWSKMFHYFNLNREDFLNHYHQRSNVESTVMMIKTKFGDSVRSKSETAAKNEVLCKVLCHNICCLISAMYETGMEIDFE